jgi:hypothetical protein
MLPAPGAQIYDFRKLKDANSAARERARQLGPGAVVMACGKVAEPTPGKVPKAPRSQRGAWNIRVVVVAEGGGKPTGPLNVTIRNSGAPFVNPAVNFPGVQSDTFIHNATGRKLLQLQITHANWSPVNQALTIDNGDDKMVVFRIVRDPWVAFRIRDLAANDYVAAVPMTLSIPGAAPAQVHNSTQINPLLFEGLPANAGTAQIHDLGAQDNTAVYVATQLRDEPEPV